jgi:pilus assembly protein CpaB
VNPRQRRGVLLLVLAVCGAVLSFVSLTSYVSEVQSRVGEMTTAVVLQRDVRAYESVPASALSVVDVPRRWLPGTVLHSTTEVAGQVASSDLRAGSYLQRGMLTLPPSVRAGEREVSLPLRADSVPTGVGPGRRVDVYATFGDATCGKAGVRRVVRGARVLDLDRAATGRDDNNVILRLALSETQSGLLSCAVGAAKNISVSLVSPQPAPTPTHKPAPKRSKSPSAEPSATPTTEATGGGS